MNGFYTKVNQRFAHNLAHPIFFWLVAIILLYARAFLKMSLDADKMFEPWGWDFYIFYITARDMLSVNIYSTPEVGVRFLYSPLFAVLMFPFTLLPQQISLFVWHFLSVLCILRCIFICFYFCRVSAGEKASWLILIFIAVFFTRMLSSDFRYGNTTFLLLWLALESNALLLQERPKYKGASFLLALGINIKLLLLPVLVYWLWRGYWRAALFSLVWLGSFLLIPSLVFGWDENIDLLMDWYFLLINRSDYSFLSDTWAALLVVMLFQLLGLVGSPNLTETTLPFAAHIIYFPEFRLISQSTAIILTYAASAIIVFLIAFTLYILRKTPPFQRSSAFLSFPELAYILLVIPFIYPVQQSYSLLFCMPLMIWVGACIIKHPAYFGKSVLAFICLAFLLALLCYFPWGLLLGDIFPAGWLWIRTYFVYLVLILSLIPLLIYCQSLPLAPMRRARTPQN